MDNRSVREDPNRWIAGAVLGIAMLLTGVVLLILRIQSYDYSGGAAVVMDNFFPILSRLLLVIGGLDIILKRKRGNYYAVGSYALFLGDQSVFDSYRMILRGIATDNGDVETCDTVRFYGEDGFFIQLIVVETYEVDEHMSLRSLRRKKQTEESEAEF